MSNVEKVYKFLAFYVHGNVFVVQIKSINRWREKEKTYSFLLPSKYFCRMENKIVMMAEGKIVLCVSPICKQFKACHVATNEQLEIFMGRFYEVNAKKAKCTNAFTL